MVLVGLISGWTAPPAQAATDGQVLSSGAVPARQLPSGAARAVKIRYATRNESGRRAEAVGVVYFPHGTPPPGGWPVVSWAHGTTGIAPQCAPSRFSGAEQDREQPSIVAALKRGYVVTATDYIGMSGTPGTEYLAGRSAAYNVIDMVRAARGNDPAIGKRWASLGHSQGGHAALWATYLANDYAPELRNVGTVALAPANHLETVIPLLAQPSVPNVGPLNRTAAFALYMLDGLNNARPGVHALDALSPRGRQWMAKARSTCLEYMSKGLADVPPGTLFTKPIGDPPIGPALRDYAAIRTQGWVGTRPILLNQGLTDMVVLPPTTALLAAQMRQGGASVTLETFPGDHTGVVSESTTATFNAIDRYFR